MSIRAILLPLFVEVALTLVLLLWTARVRVAAIRSGAAKMKDTALGQPNWPPRATQIANSYNSQFQLPVLFYVLTILAIATRHADFLFVVMAWLFVVARLAHAFIHTSSNYVPNRFNAFAVGAVVLLLMWIIFAVRILLGLP
jgi:hypothetical protein